ncbi:hypothetical protein [Amycolatopsis sp. PS_44_ISF1]|uniref:hypothetical protein n=1 Tax=Amycolatopsis sp. PS_44_ISF1 TaxID=2974917 RepID=UPI0028DEE649|nr:hypothetical protein [Amycolatopsis sp. PS_44_ISF1]MDT8909364.1 hypothetical protein [Amycolatopsis sp. PS_44_ISF1]
MTDTPGSPGPGADDETPTPSQGFPKPEGPGAGSASPPSSQSRPESSPAGSGDDARTPVSGLPRQNPPSPGGTGSAPGQPGQPGPPGQQWHSPGQPPGPQWRSPGPPPMPQQPGGGYGRPGGAWHPQGLGKPGVIALRPLNIGDILDGAITAIRRYPVLVLGVSAVVAVIVAGLNLIISLTLLPDFTRVTSLGPGATQQEQLDAVYNLLGSTLLTLIPTLIISILGETFLTGFLTVVMGKAVLGRPVGFRAAMREVAPRLLPLLGLTLLYTLATAVAAVFCLLPAVVPYVFWALAGPALVLERGTVREAFKRSQRLVSGAFWRVFGILLLAALIGWLITAIIGVPFDLGSGAFSGMFDPQATVPHQSAGSLVLQAVGGVIAATIVTPFKALVSVVLYLDQRMRREGMDIELARAAGLNPPMPPQQAW